MFRALALAFVAGTLSLPASASDMTDSGFQMDELGFGFYRPFSAGLFPQRSEMNTPRCFLAGPADPWKCILAAGKFDVNGPTIPTNHSLLAGLPVDIDVTGSTAAARK